jgi:hypothetical protein
MASREIMEIVAQVSSLLEDTPGAEELLDQVRTGSVDPERAMMQLTDLAVRAGHGEALIQASGRIEQFTTAAMVNPTNQLPMMNPVLEAAIAERASLDGDVPEFRTGAIPEGGRPAVPVITDSLDPVVVGMQLDRASKEVHAEIRQALADHHRNCQLMLDRVRKDSPEEERETRTLLVRESLPPAPIGVSGYVAGEKAIARVGVKVKPIEAAVLSPEQRRSYAYLSIATTQGRVSLTPVIQDGLVAYLKAHSLDAVAGTPHSQGAVTARWIMTLWGKDDIAEGFNPILSAIHAMCSELMALLINCPKVYLRVTPYHGIADRKFGWIVVAGPREK